MLLLALVMSVAPGESSWVLRSRVSGSPQPRFGHASATANGFYFLYGGETDNDFLGATHTH